MNISYYSRTSYWHPEEGGYYSEGMCFENSFHVRTGKGTKKIISEYKRMCEEYGESRCYITANNRECGSHGDYIGEGELICLESNRHIGKKEVGDHPYE